MFRGIGTRSGSSLHLQEVACAVVRPAEGTPNTYELNPDFGDSGARSRRLAGFDVAPSCAHGQTRSRLG